MQAATPAWNWDGETLGRGDDGAHRASRHLGLGATTAFVDQKRYQQARTWPFERDGNRLLFSGASRREAARPTDRLGALGRYFAVLVRLSGFAPLGVRALAD